jgi:transitional endoplasmic reticulum ATPase
VTRTPEAELHFSRGLLHLRRGEAILPPSMAIRDASTPPGVDVFLELIGLAAVATSKALGQTEWIESYRAEMRAAIIDFEKAAKLAPGDPEIALRKSQAHHYIGQTELARAESERAARLAPDQPEYALPPSPEARPARGESESASARGKKRGIGGGPTWDDLILPVRTKRELRQIQLLLENPHQAAALGVDPPTGLLLYGPPGTGKTTVARVLAAQARCRFFTTSPAETHSMWIGEGEKTVAKLFAEARAHAPSILFLDEIDALIPSRTGGVHQPSDKIVNQFLHEMDGLVQSTGVFFIGATNRPDMVDAALLRGGRLSRKIEIPLPDEAARRQILALNVKGAKLGAGVDLDFLSSKTDGFSGADLKALVNEAGMQALIRLADGGDGEEEAVLPADFVFALENLSES